MKFMDDMDNVRDVGAFRIYYKSFLESEICHKLIDENADIIISKMKESGKEHNNQIVYTEDYNYSTFNTLWWKYIYKYAKITEPPTVAEYARDKYDRDHMEFIGYAEDPIKTKAATYEILDYIIKPYYFPKVIDRIHEKHPEFSVSIYVDRKTYLTTVKFKKINARNQETRGNQEKPAILGLYKNLKDITTYEDRVKVLYNDVKQAYKINDYETFSLIKELLYNEFKNNPGKTVKRKN